MKVRIIFTIVVLFVSTLSQSAVASSSHRLLQTPLEWRTTGVGVRYPDSTDPTRFLPYNEQRTLECIRRYESRNHLVDGSVNQGWYQFTSSTWNSALVHDAIKGLPSSANRATGDQQSAVAVFYVERNGRFGVEWNAERNKCPGRF